MSEPTAAGIRTMVLRHHTRVARGDPVIHRPAEERRARRGRA